MLQQTHRCRQVSGTTTGRVAASGLTLIEILAAVFVLAMGLILVAAAFPVGVQQSGLMRQDTETGIFANEVLEMIKADSFTRKMSDDDFRSVFTKNKAVSFVGATKSTYGGYPGPAGNKWKWYLVRNSNRSFYSHDKDDSKMYPPTPGDWVCHPIITRLTDDGDPPLYRVSMPIQRYDPRIEPIYMPCSVAGASGKTVTISSNIGDMKVGDTVVDSRSGYCYRVIGKDAAKNQIELDREPVEPLSGSSLIVIGKFESVYYALLGL